MRFMVLWFPDWPLQAQRKATSIAAIEKGGIIQVVSQTARTRGVRRGMKTRTAQAICPDLELLRADYEYDARIFEPIAAGLDEVAANIEILRPGMALAELSAPAHFHGSEDKAAEMLLDAAARQGLDCLGGIASDLTTAIIAAKHSAVVLPGEAAQFLAPLPLNVLQEPALGVDSNTLNTLKHLGIHTLGEIAALSLTEVSTRLGKNGIYIRKLARGESSRGVSTAQIPPDLSVSFSPEYPITRVDVAAFAARSLAAQLHEKLKLHELVCQRLKILAYTADQVVSRIWRTREPLTEAATADRVRWQLDSWLTGGGAGEIYTLALEPIEVSNPPAVDLWSRDDSAARDAISRVSSQLGTNAVLQPYLGPGRGVAERIKWLPAGETPPTVAPTWVGRIPSPLPARIFSDTPIHLLNIQGKPILVTGQALLSDKPQLMYIAQKAYEIIAWAGPWPVDDSYEKAVRLQLVGVQYAESKSELNTRQRRHMQVISDNATPRQKYGWLIIWREYRWWLEGGYE
ncbi:DNA polymerase Y family protein [Corynebacterium caspium]|uniref:DNA polymerase Y family protein n=1 Tax=Corynebacterium caspium TaxID=234828 RepID=UPI0003678452|nr:DNA polymerase Y family protein [Corynebacterium caspium]WKD59777.1 DNA polymerase IV [Corynebacterium caspium DSM 44850]